MQSVLNDQLTGRIIIGILMTIFLSIIAGFVCYAKKNNNHKHWFKPIGLKSALYNERFLLWKSDYPIWLGVAIFIFFYWFGAYFIVNLIQLSQFNFVLNDAQAHGGIKFIWVPNKILTNGDIGGFDAVYYDGTPIDGSLMPYVMKQTNVNYYLFYMINDLLRGTNLENVSSPFLVFPDPFTPILTDLNVVNQNDPLYVNTVIDSLSKNNQLYLYQQAILWLHSFTFSNIFVTPLCQFLSIAFPLSIIFSYKKDIASLFAPWAFLGGFITIYGGVVADENVHVTWQLIFFDQQLFFGYHTYLLVGGLSWMIYSNRYSLSKFFYTYVLITFYVVYVLIVTRVMNIQYFTTGLTRLDYSVSGSYIIASLVLRDTNIVFPFNTIIMLFVFTSFLNLVIALKNLIHTKYWKKRLINYNETFVHDLQMFPQVFKENLNSFKMKLGFYKHEK
ncbi:DUF5378 family protein [Mycoplasmoides alvi]|uniref:DUF5378 family protein n=1 Tax=Mycoplasmoides alvi TaxID=78580 RepID=UPI00051AFB9E|nr:DUF5378 family protein [Mycoplasmoides alvi]